MDIGARGVAAVLAPRRTRRASAPRGEALAMAEAAPGFGTGTDRPAIRAESRASTSFGCAAGVERLRQREAGALIAPNWPDRLRPDRAHPLVGHLELAQFQVRSRLHVWIARSCLSRTQCLHGRCATASCPSIARRCGSGRRARRAAPPRLRAHPHWRPSFFDLQVCSPSPALGPVPLCCAQRTC